ncbi:MULTISPECIES: hypothetical protein [Arsenicicoccus]|uniref:hypothetical protein n=1 Tax=Arsenicicoccus TaxID=267408 RepID=UPI00257B3BB4|nr:MULTISPECIES: hypothetical protein [Arsenicicoccus]
MDTTTTTAGDTAVVDGTTGFLAHDLSELGRDQPRVTQLDDVDNVSILAPNGTNPLAVHAHVTRVLQDRDRAAGRVPALAYPQAQPFLPTPWHGSSAADNAPTPAGCITAVLTYAGAAQTTRVFAQRRHAERYADRQLNAGLQVLVYATLLPPSVRIPGHADIQGGGPSWLR